MRKHLIFSFMLGLLFLSVSAQQLVDKQRLAKARVKDNVLFESVLTDADMAITYKLSSRIEKRYWTLKFENGAVLNIYEGPNADVILGSVWWIGKRYVIYRGKPLMGTLAIHIELIID